MCPCVQEGIPVRGLLNGPHVQHVRNLLVGQTQNSTMPLGKYHMDAINKNTLQANLPQWTKCSIRPEGREQLLQDGILSSAASLLINTAEDW